MTDTTELCKPCILRGDNLEQDLRNRESKKQRNTCSVYVIWSLFVRTGIVGRFYNTRNYGALHDLEYCEPQEFSRPRMAELP